MVNSPGAIAYFGSRTAFGARGICQRYVHTIMCIAGVREGNVEHYYCYEVG